MISRAWKHGIMDYRVDQSSLGVQVSVLSMPLRDVSRIVTSEFSLGAPAYILLWTTIFAIT